ncbi:hypothetical protein MKW92_003483 [Papaver armeniacum]|nr:hypothetical protein MKW92_003483 [Papaver armeniacum]
MQGLKAIKQIGNEFYQGNEEASSNEEASFPSLVELHIISFLNLEEWFGDQRSTSTSSFSRLKRLEISECLKLSTTPTRFPSLKNLQFSIELESHPNLTSLPQKLLRGANHVLQTLVVKNCNEFLGFVSDGEEQQHYQPDHAPNSFLSKIEILNCPSLTVLPADFRGLDSLTYLAIKGCSSLQSLPDGIQYLPALRKLSIGGFSEDLISFPFPASTRSDGEQYFVSLRVLEIFGWPSLGDVLPDQLQLLTSLQCFTINGFPCLLSLPEWFGELSSLRTLNINNCENLRYLPSEEQMLRLTSLQNLKITWCPLLQKRCRFPNEEWHKIADFNLTKAGTSHSQYERMGDTMLMKSRKVNGKLWKHTLYSKVDNEG